MITKNIMVTNSVGIHSRPAALLVESAGHFKSQITITHGDRSASAVSMIKVLSLRVKQDNEITITAEGEDEQEAVDTLCRLIETKFGEE